MLKTFEFNIARDGETFAEDFLAENRDCAELDIVVRINEVWSTDYATFDDLTADCDGFDLIEHSAVMAQRIPLATMEAYRGLADWLSDVVEEKSTDDGLLLNATAKTTLADMLETIAIADPSGEPGGAVPLGETAALRSFVGMIARMNAGEDEENLDDDAVATMCGLIEQARAIVGTASPLAYQVKVWSVAMDTDNGTTSDAFATEREAEDCVLAAVDSTREEFEEAGGGAFEFDGDKGFWAFVAARRDDLDTHNIEEHTITVPTVIPIAAKGEEG